MYAVSTLVSSVQFATFGKKMIFDTYQWYKKRQGQQVNKITSFAEDGNDSQQRPIELEESGVVNDTSASHIKPEIPFLDYRTGEGEGQRKLGTQLRLSEDVYAVLFVGLLKAEYKEAYDQNLKTESEKDKNAVNVRRSIAEAEAVIESIHSHHLIDKDEVNVTANVTDRPTPSMRSGTQMNRDQHVSSKLSHTRDTVDASTRKVDGGKGEKMDVKMSDS